MAKIAVNKEVEEVATEDQIADLLDESPSDETSEEEEIEEVEEEEQEEEEEEEAEEESEEEEPEEEESEEEEETEETEEDETEDDEEDEEAQKTLDEMRNFVNAEAAKASQSLEEDDEDVQLEKFEITQEDYETALESPEKFSELINRAITVDRKNIELTQKKQAKQFAKIQKAVDDFYTENADLKQFDNVVSLVAGNLQREHKDWSYEDVLKNAESIVRDKLKLPKTNKERKVKKKSQKVEAKKKVIKSTVKTPKASRNKGEDTRSEKQKQIDDLIN